MATPAAAGCLSLAQENLKKTLAASATFQALVGAEDAAAALASIFDDGLTLPADPSLGYTLDEYKALLPYAIAWTQEQAGFRKRRLAHKTYQESGRLKLSLVRAVPPGYAGAIAEHSVDWKNRTGKIIDEICALSGEAPYLEITEVVVDEGPYRCHPDLAPTEGDYEGVELGITHGV